MKTPGRKEEGGRKKTVMKIALQSKAANKATRGVTANCRTVIKIAVIATMRAVAVKWEDASVHHPRGTEVCKDASKQARNEDCNALVSAAWPT